MARSRLFRVLPVIVPLAACAVDLEPEPLEDENGALQAFPGRSGEHRSGTIDTGHGPMHIAYEVIDGVAIAEGDIDLGPADLIAEQGKGVLRSAGRSDADYRWNDGNIPYELAGDLSDQKKADIQFAIDHWNGNTPYWFHPRNGEGDYIRFVYGAGCKSKVGHQGGRQDVSLGKGCGKGAAIHEIGHAVGLWHEQSRTDRDKFVVIHWENIDPAKTTDFQTYSERDEDGRNFFTYDYDSIMHYGAKSFSSNGQDTISRVDGQPLVTQGGHLSPTDIAGAFRELPHDDRQQAFKLVNVNSGKCLDVEGGSRDPNAKVHQWTCHGKGNQRWYVWKLPSPSSRVVLVNQWSGHCLDLPDNKNGTELKQYPCHAFENQQFNVLTAPDPDVDDTVRFQVQSSGKCLDVDLYSTEDGARIQQAPCDGSTKQGWVFRN